MNRKAMYSKNKQTKNKSRNPKLFVLHYSYEINTLILLVKVGRVIQQASL